MKLNFNSKVYHPQSQVCFSFKSSFSEKRLKNQLFYSLLLQLERSISFTNYHIARYFLISFHILGSAATLISLLGMVFNVVTIAALLNHTPIRRHVTTPFVISLAFSDLLFSITVLPVMAVRFFTEYDPPYYFFLLQ